MWVLCLVILVTISSLPRIQSAIDESDFAPMKSQSTGTSISNFDGFTKLNESAHITSTKTSSEITFAFNGSSSTWVTERYIYTIADGSYCDDFSIQATLGYSFTDTDDLTNVGMIVGSYYDGDTNYLGEPGILTDEVHAYTSVMDSWSGNQAVHQVIFFNNSVPDELFNAYGSAGLTGTVLINQTRKAGLWNCSVMDSSGTTTYTTKTWSNVSQEVNYIIIFYNAQNSNSDTSATISSITANLEIITEVEPDITAPDLTIIAPINNSIIPTNNITVVWSGADNESGLKNYYIQLDSEEWIDVNLTTSYMFESLTDGIHTIEVKALDKNLNERTCLVTFTVNTLTSSPSTMSLFGFTYIAVISTLIVFVSLTRISKRLRQNYKT